MELPPDIILGTSTVEHGNMSLRFDEHEMVTARRRRFLQEHGVALGQCVVMSVEHSDTVVEVTGANGGEMRTAEALVTNQSGVALFLLTADCLPVSIIDPVKRVISLLHLGWRPTDKRLAQKVVAYMTARFQSKPEDLLVVFGPGIHKESYRVTELLQRDSPDWQPYVKPLEAGESAVDIVSYNQDQLLAFGVLPDHISVSPIDTGVDTRYFSHYRSKRSAEPEGRFATVLMQR